MLYSNTCRMFVYLILHSNNPNTYIDFVSFDVYFLTRSDVIVSKVLSYQDLYRYVFNLFFVNY